MIRAKATVVSSVQRIPIKCLFLKLSLRKLKLRVKSRPKVVLLRGSSNELVSSCYDKQKNPTTVDKDILRTNELWSPLFSLHAIALIPLSLAKVRLSPTLTLSPLMIWYSGLTALYFFLLAKAALAYLPTPLSVALRPLCPSQQAQYVLVFPLKPAPFCTLFAGLSSTSKSATSLLFSFYLTLALSSPPCPLLHLSLYLKLSGRSGSNYLLFPPVLSGYNGSPDTRFSRGTTRLTSWPDEERYLRPLQSLVVSLLFSLVSTLVFSRIGGALSHRNSLTHGVD